MSASLAKALAALDRLDADPPPSEDEAMDLEEAAHHDIAVGLGLTVFPPSNYPYTTVSDRPDANPYSQERDEVREMPGYSTSFQDALSLEPKGYALVMRQVGLRWRAAYKPVGEDEPAAAAWKESARPARAIARAALAARLEAR